MIHCAALFVPNPVFTFFHRPFRPFVAQRASIREGVPLVCCLSQVRILKCTLALTFQAPSNPPRFSFSLFSPLTSYGSLCPLPPPFIRVLIYRGKVSFHFLWHLWMVFFRGRNVRWPALPRWRSFNQSFLSNRFFFYFLSRTCSPVYSQIYFPLPFFFLPSLIQRSTTYAFTGNPLARLDFAGLVVVHPLSYPSILPLTTLDQHLVPSPLLGPFGAPILALNLMVPSASLCDWALKCPADPRPSDCCQEALDPGPIFFCPSGGGVSHPPRPPKLPLIFFKLLEKGPSVSFLFSFMVSTKRAGVCCLSKLRTVFEIAEGFISLLFQYLLFSSLFHHLCPSLSFW